MVLNQKEKLWEFFDKEGFRETVYKEEGCFSKEEREILKLTSKKLLIQNKWLIVLGVMVLYLINQFGFDFLNRIVVERYGVFWVRDIVIWIVTIIAIISFIQDIIKREKALKIMNNFKKSKSIFNATYINLYKIIVYYCYLIGGVLWWTEMNAEYAVEQYTTIYEKWLTIANILFIIYLVGYLLYYGILKSLLGTTTENLAKAIERGAILEVKKNVEYESNMANFLGDNYAIIFKEIGLLIEEAEKVIEGENEVLNYRNEVITNAAHDIKTPITSIKNYIYILENKNLSLEEKEEYLKILKDKVKKLELLIKNLKFAENISNYEINLEKVNMEALTREVLEEYRSELNLKRLVFEIENSYSGDITCDREHSKTILRNIISNIFKYALEDSKCKILIKKNNNKIVVEFINKTKEKINLTGEEILKRFKRANEARNTEGNGLGLDIANNLMKLQGGNLDVVIEKETFKVRLTY